VDELEYFLAPEFHDYMRNNTIDWNDYLLNQHKEALAKKERGEELTSREESALVFQPRPMPIMEDHIRKYQPAEFVSMFGTNVDQYIQFYDENRDYFWANTTRTIIVDQDAKSLGIPNNDKRLLDAAIKLLESGKDVEKARRILSRYTLVDFATAKEWRNWYNTY
jgi:hypothetical protein